MTDIDLSEHTPVLDAVRDILRAQLALGDEPIEPDQDLDLLPNADSVRLMRSVSVLERRFDIELDDDDIRRARTVGDLARLVAAEVSGPGASR